MIWDTRNQHWTSPDIFAVSTERNSIQPSVSFVEYRSSADPRIRPTKLRWCDDSPQLRLLMVLHQKVQYPRCALHGTPWMLPSFHTRSPWDSFCQASTRALHGTPWMLAVLRPIDTSVADKNRHYTSIHHVSRADQNRADLKRAENVMRHVEMWSVVRQKGTDRKSCKFISRVKHHKQRIMLALPELHQYRRKNLVSQMFQIIVLWRRTFNSIVVIFVLWKSFQCSATLRHAIEKSNDKYMTLIQNCGIELSWLEFIMNSIWSQIRIRTLIWIRNMNLKLTLNLNLNLSL